MSPSPAPDAVIDIDGHVLMEAAADWLDYFEPPDARELEEQLRQNRRHWYSREGSEGDALYATIRERVIAGGAGGWDPGARLRVMDDEGIDCVVLFPTEIGLKLDAYSPAVCRGYNQWLADYCASDRSRLLGVALLPLDDAQAAADELERCVRDCGFVGFFMKNSVNDRMCDARHYDPLYARAEALGVPLLLHIPSQLKDLVEDHFGYDFLRSHVLHPVSQMLSVMDVLYGGVLDRFPRLRVGFMEGQVGWLPWFLARLDDQLEQYGSRPGLDPGIAKAPSAYLEEGRLFFSCDTDEPYLVFAANAQLGPATRGDACIVWGSDYPHSDCTFPGALETLLAQPGLDEAQARRITRSNPRRLLFGAEQK
jgi:predicted TIM-barrel fold metal-dependent hydrolase